MKACAATDDVVVLLDDDIVVECLPMQYDEILSEVSRLLCVVLCCFNEIEPDLWLAHLQSVRKCSSATSVSGSLVTVKEFQRDVKRRAMSV